MRSRAVLLVAVLLAVVPMLSTATELDLLPLGEPERAFAVASLAPGNYLDCIGGVELSFDEVVDRLAAARVVLLGEDHTSMEQKLLQARLLEALAERGVGLVLGMEFFQRSDAEALARWSADEMDEEELLQATGWYERSASRYDYSRPVMEVCRRYRIPVVGLNVPRQIVRAINRGGLDSLSPEQQVIVGEVQTEGSPQHRYLIGRMLGETVTMMPPVWFTNMYAAQCTWDVVMARSILDALPPTGTMVVVVGAGHVSYGLGIPRRITEEVAARGLPALPVVSFCPVEAPVPADDEDGPTGHPMGPMKGPDWPTPARFVRSLADVVGAFADTGELLPFPQLGLMLSEDENGLGVSMALPGSFAESAGLRHGDRIIDLNGAAVTEIAKLRRRLAELEWGQRLDLRISRDEQTLDVAALLYPEVATTETVLAPGWKVTPTAPFEPGGSDPVQADKKEQHKRVLVSQKGQAQRVEIWHGKVLAEVHELDEAGRVRRSLLREPAADGAVELRYERDADGKVVTVSRRDRAGQELP